jgi:predicted O-methyltransferase YrrM
MGVLMLYRKLDPGNPLRTVARRLRETVRKHATAETRKASSIITRQQQASLAAAAERQRRDDLALVSKALQSKPDNLGANIEALDAIDRINMAAGVGSHTTIRFRREMLYWLLDNPARGPIVEVGTMYGGMTALFGYIAAVTGRHCFAIDIDEPRMELTKKTCSIVGVERNVTFCLGDLKQFVDQGTATERPDLVFLDASHDYNSTIHDLRVLHKSTIPRSLAFHDYNYRHSHQRTWFGDLVAKNPIAVDIACRDFFDKEFSETVIFKRCGAFSGDGTVATPDNPGAMMGDYVDRYGSEGMMVFYA